MIKITHPNMLKDSMHNLDLSVTAPNPDITCGQTCSQIYGRGIILGIVSAFMSQGMTFEKALTTALDHSRIDSIDLGSIPWKDAVDAYRNRKTLLPKPKNLA